MYYFDLMRIRHQEIMIKAAMKKAQDAAPAGRRGLEAALCRSPEMVLKLDDAEARQPDRRLARGLRGADRRLRHAATGHR